MQAVGAHSSGLFSCASRRRICNHIKGLAKYGRQDPVRPGAVREYEIQEAAFLTGGLLLEEVGGTAGQLQKSDSPHRGRTDWLPNARYANRKFAGCVLVSDQEHRPQRLDGRYDRMADVCPQAGSVARPELCRPEAGLHRPPAVYDHPGPGSQRHPERRRLQ
jgi:hypothetical protein